MRCPTNDIYEKVTYLLSQLGRTSVAYVAGARSRAMPARWAAPPDEKSHADPSIDESRRLEAAYAIFRSIEDADNDQVAARWLLAANPRLDGATPVELIRNDHGPAVYRAAEAFIRNGDSS
jgi:hypothetical protein